MPSTARLTPGAKLQCARATFYFIIGIVPSPMKRRLLEIIRAMGGPAQQFRLRAISPKSDFA